MDRPSRWQRARRLTDFGGARVTAPAWKPDGREIAFHLSREGNSDIYSAPVKGGEVRRLTHDASNESSPEWSRMDGESIYFVSDRGGRPQSGSNQQWAVRRADHIRRNV